MNKQEQRREQAKRRRDKLAIAEWKKKRAAARKTGSKVR
jgi:hypothetical protein